MAVEAHNPSTVYLFHRGNDQDVPPEPARKRAREHQVVSREEGGFHGGDFTLLPRVEIEEVDLYFRVQGERLRRKLGESNGRYYAALAAAAARRLGEVEAELEKVRRRGVELEGRAARMEEEAAAWRKRAAESEAAAEELRRAVPEDRASDAESSLERSTGPPACRACGEAAATVVALPCRHLGLCRTCDAAAAACPVCSCPKSLGVEVYLH